MFRKYVDDNFAKLIDSIQVNKEFVLILLFHIQNLQLKV